MKDVLRKYADEEDVDENTCIPNRKERKRKCEQRWTEEVQRKCGVRRPWTYMQQ